MVKFPHLKCLYRDITEPHLAPAAGVEDPRHVDGKVQLAVVGEDVRRDPGEARLPRHVAADRLHPGEAVQAGGGVGVAAAGHHLDPAPRAQTPGELEADAATCALDEGNGHGIQ